VTQHNSTFRFTQVFHLVLLITYAGIILPLGSEKKLRAKGQNKKKREKKIDGGWLSNDVFRISNYVYSWCKKLHCHVY
jgi:hypothetical protein